MIARTTVVRDDPALEVVRALDLAAASGLLDGPLHRGRHGVGVHDDAAVHVSRGAPDRLDERARTAEKPLLVRVEDRDERHLGQVEPLAQEIDPHEHVELAEPQIAKDVDSLERVDVRVQVPHADAELAVVVRQVLRHALGERGHEHALVLLDPDLDLAEQVVDLPGHGAHLDLGIHESRRPDELLDDDPLHLVELVLAGGRRDVDRLAHVVLELLELERPVVERARQTKAVVDQRLFARAVAPVHRLNLRDRLVGLVDDEQEVRREVVDQRRRRFARLAPRKVPRVVLDARAEPHLLHHLEVVERPLLEPLLLEEAALLVVEVEPFTELLANAFDRAAHLGLRRHVVRAGVDRGSARGFPSRGRGADRPP